MFGLFNNNNEKQRYLEFLGECGVPVNDKSSWVVRYPKRAVEEIAKMMDNTNSILNCDGNKLIWEELITNSFGSPFLISIETKGYPFKMPKVFVKEPKIEPSTDKHMYTDDGRLCLLHPDAYHSKISILDIRNFAAAWCWCIEVYQNTSEWPAAEYKH